MKTDAWAITREGITHIIYATSGGHALLIAKDWQRLGCWTCPLCEKCATLHG